MLLLPKSSMAASSISCGMPSKKPFMSQVAKGTPTAALASGRYNILVIGIDQRPDEKTVADRTDTLILVTIDTNTGQVGMLSIPRDLLDYIPPPVNQYNKINTAPF